MKLNLKLILIKVKHVKFKSNKNTLHGDFIKTSLEELQHRLILTPTDMTNGNVAVIYEKIYALTLMTKVTLRVNYGNTSRTYETYADKSNDQLIDIMLKLFLHILIFL